MLHRCSSLLLILALPASLVACGSAPSKAGPGPADGGATGADGSTIAPTDGGATGADGSTPPTGDGGTSATVCTVASKGTSGTLLSGTLLLPAGPTQGELLISAAGAIV